MNMNSSIGSGAAVLLLSLGLASAADDFGAKGRDIFKKYQGAVVTLEVVIKSKISMQGMPARSNESKRDVTGTVVDPSGLAVMALSEIEPGSMLQNMMGDGESRFRMETEVADLKLLSADGTELPAEVVLRDRDLDLAFVRPKTKPGAPMAAVDLTQAGQAQVLDEVIALNRLGQAANRAFSASVERIAAIIPKPRLFYVPDSNATSTSMGSPAFTLDGKVLGIFVMRAVRGNSGGGGSNFQRSNVTSVILPAADVLKAAKQAPDVKPESQEEKK